MNWLQKTCQYKSLPLPFEDALPVTEFDSQGSEFMGREHMDRRMTEETAKMEEEALNQMKYLGQGNQGIVYELDDRVIKYTDRITEYMAALKAFKDPIPCIVPVLEEPKRIQEDTPTNQNPTHPTIWRIILEKVETFKGEDFKMVAFLYDRREDMVNHMGAMSEKDFLSGHLQVTDNEQYRQRFTYLYRLYKAMYFCLSENGYVANDAHAGNVGLKDGRMVLIDLGNTVKFG